MNTQNPVTNIRNRLSGWLRRAQEYAELSRMDDRHLQDMGLCRSDITPVVKDSAGVEDRVRALAEKIGLSYEQIMKERWRALEVITSCSRCRERRACRHWLEDAEPEQDYQDFCPNAQIFESLKQ